MKRNIINGVRVDFQSGENKQVDKERNLTKLKGCLFRLRWYNGWSNVATGASNWDHTAKLKCPSGPP